MTEAPPFVLAMLAQAAPDTVLVAPVATEGWRMWVDTLSGLAQIVIALALVLLGLGAIVAALAARRAYRNAQRQIDRLRIDLQPLLKGANTVGENVARISAAAREETERVQRGLRAAQLRAEAAADAAEARVGELHALLDVVQEEAEELFIGTAATLRGARAGALAYREGADPDPHRTDDEVSDEELEDRIARGDRSIRRAR